MKTAILVDGAFYLHRARRIFGKQTPKDAACTLSQYCKAHIERCQRDNPNTELYRIFYYDCPPADLHAVNPISNKHIRYIEKSSAKWRLEFFEELKKLRKTALRLGEMDSRNPIWTLSGQKLKDLCQKKISIDDLTEDDIKLDIRQKGVDMKLGLDIASISYKKQVQQIILIAGDSDFVPAAKLARREGIDFILDNLWHPIRDNLFEHIDGKRSMVKNKDMNGQFDGVIFHEWSKVKNKKLRGKINNK